MKKTILYTYLGTNGILTTPIHLEGIYSTKSYRLAAEKGKVLTKSGMRFTKNVIVPEVDVDLWYEVDESFGQV